jgi:hypothetical protein
MHSGQRLASQAPTTGFVLGFQLLREAVFSSRFSYAYPLLRRHQKLGRGRVGGAFWLGSPAP